MPKIHLVASFTGPTHNTPHQHNLPQSFDTMDSNKKTNEKDADKKPAEE
jgi:hypothetical protein